MFHEHIAGFHKCIWTVYMSKVFNIDIDVCIYLYINIYLYMHTLFPAYLYIYIYACVCVFNTVARCYKVQL